MVRELGWRDDSLLLLVRSSRDGETPGAPAAERARGGKERGRRSFFFSSFRWSFLSSIARNNLFNSAVF